MNKLTALFLLLSISPLLLLIIILMVLTQGRGFLFRQKRLGKNGEKFVCYKFRTMLHNAHREKIRWKKSNPELWAEYEKNNFKLKKDYRITKLGRTLRKTSLDELPQLLNVIKGEMNLIGPRPILLREKKYYGTAFRYYKKVKPGITGLWQVKGRSKTSFKDRVILDCLYIRKRTLKLNFYILYKTFIILIKRNGAY